MALRRDVSVQLLVRRPVIDRRSRTLEPYAGLGMGRHDLQLLPRQQPQVVGHRPLLHGERLGGREGQVWYGFGLPLGRRRLFQLLRFLVLFWLLF